MQARVDNPLWRRGVANNTLIRGLLINRQRQIICGSDHLWSVGCGRLRLLHHYAAQGVGMRSQAYAFLLGAVAIFAGLATMEFNSSRLIDIFGGAAVLDGLGSVAWASGRSFFRMYIGVPLIAVLVGAATEILDLHLLARTSYPFWGPKSLVVSPRLWIKSSIAAVALPDDWHRHLAWPE
jgi:hypothetical protein